MANNDSTRPGFDLSPWLGRDPLNIFQAAWLWAGISPSLPTSPENEARYSRELAAASDWFGRLNDAAKSGRLAIQGQPPTKQEQTRRAVGGSAYLGRSGRPAEYREVEAHDWRAALVALADLRNYAESIGQRPAFFFPGPLVPTTGGATPAGGQAAPASDTNEPPRGWRSGLKRMAHEEAVNLVREHGALHGPALWAAMKAREDVKEAGRDSDQIEPKGCKIKLTRGEARVSKTQVQNAWRKELAELLL